MSPAKWINSVRAIGIVTKAGRYGGTYITMLIEQGKPQSERLIMLHALAVRQMKTLESISMEQLPLLPEGDKK